MAIGILDHFLDTAGAIALEHRVVLALAAVLAALWLWERFDVTLERSADVPLMWTAPDVVDAPLEIPIVAVAPPVVDIDGLDVEWLALQARKGAAQ